MPWVVTLTILVASAFLMDMSFTMITPFLPVYLSSELGTKASEVDMWSGAVFAVTFFVSGLLDRLGCIGRPQKPQTHGVKSFDWFDD